MIDQVSAIVQSFNVLPHLGALVIAYLLALPIGWDRERSERSAGLRTFPLVAIASCGFIQATENLTAGNPEATARIVEGLITGMGFIGGGAILVVSKSVRGLRRRPVSGLREQLEPLSGWAPTISRSSYRS